MKTRLTALVLGIVSLAILLWRIGVPPLLFDEGCYVPAARAFLANAPNPVPESPPLGKILIAAGIKVFGDNPLGWRVMSAVFGASILVGIFLWVHLLLHDYELALAAALLSLFNNFVFVMSRVGMLDVFLVGFAIWGVVGFTAVLDLEGLSPAKRRGLLALSGATLGCAFACKWNGVDTWAVVIAVAALLLWLEKRSKDETIARYARNLRQVGIIPVMLCLLLVPLIAYSATFWPLCRSIHRPFNLRELVAMQVFMWRFQRAAGGNPFISTHWYSWILRLGPQRVLSYLVGNWVVMWAGLLAIVFCLRRFWNSLPETFVVLLYAVNILQWAITPRRFMYYYYYFPAAMFLGVAIVVALHRLPPRVFGIRLSVICLLAAGCVFLFCLPRMAHMDAPFDCALGCWD
jgi:dolichyl-phosphate-mannose--protein O-mannosyl transferase